MIDSQTARKTHVIAFAGNVDNIKGKDENEKKAAAAQQHIEQQEVPGHVAQQILPVLVAGLEPLVREYLLHLLAQGLQPRVRSDAQRQGIGLAGVDTKIRLQP